jgi:fibronectin type 3 domain-containing protein
MEAALNPQPVPDNGILDRDVQPGQQWCYVVRSVASADPLVESAPSPEACAAVKDVAPPAPPAGLAALVEAAVIELSWSPSGEVDLASYRVYRAAGEGAPQRLAEVPAPATEIKDTAPGRGGPHFYTVTAVDRAGNESAPSAPVEAHLPEG